LPHFLGVPAGAAGGAGTSGGSPLKAVLPGRTARARGYEPTAQIYT
jgi:hypothetical protein